MNNDGKENRQITNTETNKMRAELSPEGMHILYNQVKNNNGRIQGFLFMIKIDGTDNLNLTQAIK